MGKKATSEGKRHAGGSGKTTLEGITKPAMRRLAKRGGVKIVSALSYEEMRGTMRVFLENVVRDAIVHTDAARRKTITSADVVQALDTNGRHLLGIEGAL